MTKLAFIDTETTGLDPDVHEIWEVGLITKPYMTGDEPWKEVSWLLPVDLGRADPYALDVGRFHDRHPQGYGSTNDSMKLVPLVDFAAEFAEWTRGCHLVGANPRFDEERLRKLLRANGACFDVHYHLIDVEAMALGYTRGVGSSKGKTTRDVANMISIPFKSDDLWPALGIDPANFDRHTALGDARLVKAVYERVMGVEK